MLSKPVNITCWNEGFRLPVMSNCFLIDEKKSLHWPNQGVAFFVFCFPFSFWFSLLFFWVATQKIKRKSNHFSLVGGCFFFFVCFLLSGDCKFLLYFPLPFLGWFGKVVMRCTKRKRFIGFWAMEMEKLIAHTHKLWVHSDDMICLGCFFVLFFDIVSVSYWI